MSDKALDAFLTTANTKKTELPEELLVKIFEIEKNNQYRDGSERGSVVRQIQKVVDQHFEKEGS